MENGKTRKSVSREDGVKILGIVVRVGVVRRVGSVGPPSGPSKTEYAKSPEATRQGDEAEEDAGRKGGKS